MIASTITAVEGYRQTRPLTEPDESPSGGAAVGRATQSFLDTMRQSEAQAMSSMTSTHDPHALVHALAQTELAVETAVTLRDKVVEAYQEILRMPV